MVTIPGAGTFRLASMGKRFLARLLDGLIIGVPLGVIGAILLANIGTNSGLVTILVFTGGIIVLTVIYEVGMISSKGATVGKLAVGVRVVTAQTAAVPGRGIGGGPAFARWAVLNLPGIVPGVGGLWVLICVLSPLFDNVGRRGFHDKAAKTWVLSTK
jgi:uncharacterized RDD family membrane protein YckC